MRKKNSESANLVVGLLCLFALAILESEKAKTNLIRSRRAAQLTIPFE